jgi:hypothetical protein
MDRVIGGDGVEYGPVRAEQLRQWTAEGRVNSRTQIRADGQPDWRPLQRFRARSRARRKARLWCWWAFLPSAVAIGLYLLGAIVVKGSAQ